MLSQLVHELSPRCGHIAQAVRQGDVESARLFISEREYALAIVDIHLVGRAGDDGLDLAEWICRETTTPVIVMTGHGDDVDASEVFRLGATDFIEKPFEAERVLAAVEQALSGTR